jgi:hypothetical protein
MLRRPLVLAKLALVMSIALTMAAAAPASVAAAPGESHVVLAQEGDKGGGQTETGPPWTYQMARITVVLVVFLGLGLGLLYYRLVVRRRRGDS